MVLYFAILAKYLQFLEKLLMIWVKMVLYSSNLFCNIRKIAYNFGENGAQLPHFILQY